MPTFEEQIGAVVDQMIREGRIGSDLRQNYIQMMSANPQTAEFFAGTLSKGLDYTRKTQELAEQKRQGLAEVEQTRKAVEAQRAQLEQWQQNVMPEWQRLQMVEREKQELAQKTAAYEQALRDYQLLDQVSVPAGSGAGFSPTNLGTSQGAPVPYNNINQPSNHSTHIPNSSTPTNFLTREEAGEAIRQLMDQQGKALRIVMQHQGLFGQPLTDDILREAMAAGQDVEEFYNSKYNVSAKRDELRRMDEERRLAELKQQIRQEVMQEVTSDPGRILQPGGNFGVQQKGMVLDKYMHDRAGLESLAGNSTDPNAPKPSPEKMPDLALSRDRVNEASNYYNKYFNPDGSPKAGATPP